MNRRREIRVFFCSVPSVNHEIYMQRCIELALKAKGNTYPNPMVGSVIVHSGKIIGEGYHRKAGEPHAEINAINSVQNKELLPDSTIYVSLEPCSHYGKTPPCALKLKEIGFREVVIGTMDSYDEVNGKGKHILEEAGIKVISGVLQKECRNLNKRFFTFHEKKRPFIVLKWAESGDGFIDYDFKPAAVSNEMVNQLVHQMRNDEHAILIGTQTALNDNPSLTTRNISGRNPVRILIDFDLKVSDGSSIFSEEASTIIINSQKNEEKGHLKFIKTERENFPENLMAVLYRENIQSVLVEGGAKTLQSFFNEGLWDEAIVIVNPELKFHSGTKAPELMHNAASSTINIRNNSVRCFENTKG